MLRVQRGAPPARPDSERLAIIEAKLDAILQLMQQAIAEDQVDDEAELADGERDQTQPL